MKSHLTIALVICFLGIAACGKNYDGKKTVRNNSSHSLKILIYKKHNPGEIGQTFLLQPQSEVVVESFTGGKSGPYYNDGKGCGSNDFDSTVVEVVDNIQFQVSKDLNSSDSWVFSKDSGIKGVDTECRATITDADIVPKSN